MTLSIDREHTALLAMDFENDIVHENGAFKDLGFAQMVKQNDVLGKTARLLDAARGAGVKVIYASVKFRSGYPERPQNAGMFQAVVGANALVEGTWGSTIHEAVTPKEGEPVVSKRGISAFTGSDLAALLTTGGITTLLLTGVATNFVVEGTAREAVDRGYNVVIVGDCCASASQEVHDSALTSTLPFLTTISNSEEVLAALN
ncbi:MAG: isochorismatase family cysteine hydrolase [Dehalococcoidia bacterium]|jgi:nicotinamidase-related amidase|nr:isochorismatase family cysteine hydrolase [Dehalococcoidia bacterium]MDP6228965.1 isochorismatase family cysteine hydrolase [Dehalococcoidia bacterium]MDP7085312.1 isochorismatase family cysteine hydrolase [Dehalococcoidia bacterium]MDP7200576.1 isochorismatase family cysteine hydrolase [Dehalococcoidia bacterium]MDP7509949.1 isochorismatase family cysteine hydrolase [Dehalococcoidia bacterium]